MTSSFLQPGSACARSRPPGWLRLVIAFGVLAGLKYVLPSVGVPRVAPVLVLLAAATAFAWRFWWNCSPDRRGVAFLVATLWVAGLIKIARL